MWRVYTYLEYFWHIFKGGIRHAQRRSLREWYADPEVLIAMSLYLASTWPSPRDNGAPDTLFRFVTGVGSETVEANLNVSADER